jgi:hypothetical protein
MRKLLIILFLLVSAASFSQLSDGSVTGNQTVIRINYGGLNTQALEWLPDDYDAEGNEEKTYPLMIFLHGMGEGQTNNIAAITNMGPPYHIKNGMKPYGLYSNGDTGKFIVISPHAANTGWSYNIGHIKLILPWLKANYRIKESQVYVSGISAGGAGAWSGPSEDTVFVRQNIAGIIPISAVEYTLGNMDNNRIRLKHCVRNGMGVIHVCGAADAHNVEHIRYDTCIQNAPPIDGKYYYKTIPGADHGPDAWNVPYEYSYTEFDGKNLWDKILEWSRGDEEEEPEEPTGCGGVRRNITPSSGGRYLNGNSYTYNPGDTLVISGSDTWTGGLEIDNFHGTHECPVVIINDGDVQMGAGFNMEHCSYIKLTGSGSESEYGFYIEGTGGGVALEVTGRSKCIEIERVKVYNKNYGVWCKQEANCADSVWALTIPGYEDVTSDNGWRIDSISLHDCDFRLIGQDGLYFGSTSPNGTRDISCSGETIYPIPPRLSNIQIYNNLLDSCNRTGIQLSGADQGTNRIYKNTVMRCGYEYNQTQGSGIILGGDTRATVDSNYIRRTFMHGIMCIGSGTSYIEHNDIDSSGILDDVTNTTSQPTNIFGDTRNTVPANDSVRLIIRNNIVGANAVADGKQIIINNTNGTFATGNVICNNTKQSGGTADVYYANTIDVLPCGNTFRIKRFGKLRYSPPN